MPEPKKITPEALVEALRLFREAASYARGLRHVQSRIDESTIVARNRMDGMAACLKGIGLLLREQMGTLDLPLQQLDAIRGTKQPVVYDMEWKEVGRASFEIYINGNQSKPVRLTRQEWEFLRFVAESPGSRDGPAASRSLEEAVAYLSKGESRSHDLSGYVTHLVSRINLALGKQGYEGLLKRDDQQGVIFSFRGNL